MSVRLGMLVSATVSAAFIGSLLAPPAMAECSKLPNFAKVPAALKASTKPSGGANNGGLDRGRRADKGGEKMSAKRWVRLVALGLFGAFGTVSLARAEKTVTTEQQRAVYHVVKSEAMQVGDVPGHVLGIVDASGLWFNMDTGEVCNYTNKIFIDLTNGTGPHQTYAMVTCEDKSTIVSVQRGVTTAHPHGTSIFEGTFTYTGGTGRFSGIMGGGSYSGKRMAPITTGGAADSFGDVVATYTLPSQ